jgi:1-acyl-sn-glycerol-3-phosphate acyltransferase
VLFPEGTRRAPGDPPQYQTGIALLYRSLNVPVVPMALNSGRFWPRHRFLRRPGTIVFEFLPPIPPGLESKVFLARLTESIESASDRLITENAGDTPPPRVTADLVQEQ